MSALTDRDRQAINMATKVRYENIARDLRALADEAEREAGRVGETNRSRLATATEFIRRFHNMVPNIGLAHLIATADEGDRTEAEWTSDGTGFEGEDGA